MAVYPEWYNDISQYVMASAWAGEVGTYQDVVWRAQQEAGGLALISEEQIEKAKEQLKAIEADWEAAKSGFATGGEQIPPIDWGFPPAKSLGAGTTEFGIGGEPAAEEPEDTAGMSEMEYVESLADALEMRPESVLDLIKQVFPGENAVKEFQDMYGKSPALGFLAIQGAAETYLGAPTEPSPTAGWEGGYPGVGAGAAGAGAEAAPGIDWPPGAFFDLLRSQELPGGAGTPSGFYNAMSQVMSPLQGADELDFLNRFAQPGQYYPGSFYTLMGNAALPQMVTAGEDVLGLLGKAWPDMIAPGSSIDLSGLGSALSQPAAPQLGAFLASMLQSNPEMGLALMEAAMGMQQEAAMPFLPMMLGPGAQEGGGGGLNDFLAMLLGGI